MAMREEQLQQNLDENNMSKTERMELLSINFYETLFKKLLLLSNNKRNFKPYVTAEQQSSTSLFRSVTSSVTV